MSMSLTMPPTMTTNSRHTRHTRRRWPLRGWHCTVFPLVLVLILLSTIATSSATAANVDDLKKTIQDNNPFSSNKKPSSSSSSSSNGNANTTNSNVGPACKSQFDCFHLSNHHCDPFSLRCTPMLSYHAPCRYDQQCVTHWCDKTPPKVSWWRRLFGAKKDASASASASAAANATTSTDMKHDVGASGMKLPPLLVIPDARTMAVEGRCEMQSARQPEEDAADDSKKDNSDATPLPISYTDAIPCTYASDCGSAQFCAKAGVCVARLSLGGVCLGSWECEAGLICAEERCQVVTVDDTTAFFQTAFLLPVLIVASILTLLILLGVYCWHKRRYRKHIERALARSSRRDQRAMDEDVGDMGASEMGMIIGRGPTLYTAEANSGASGAGSMNGGNTGVGIGSGTGGRTTTTMTGSESTQHSTSARSTHTRASTNDEPLPLYPGLPSDPVLSPIELTAPPAAYLPNASSRPASPCVMVEVGGRPVSAQSNPRGDHGS